MLKRCIYYYNPALSVNYCTINLLLLLVCYFSKTTQNQASTAGELRKHLLHRNKLNIASGRAEEEQIDGLRRAQERVCHKYEGENVRMGQNRLCVMANNTG